MSVEDDEHQRPACAACATPLQGLYCHQCGQAHGSDRGVGFLAKDALAEALSMEGKSVHTLRDMFWRPGRLLDAYRKGVGDYYFTPFKLFLLVSAFFFVFVSWVDVPIYQYLPSRTGGPVSVKLIERGFEVRGVEYFDAYLRPKVERPVIPELERAFERAIPNATPAQVEAIKLYRDYNAAYQAMNDFWNTWLPRLLWLLAPFYVALLYVFFHHRTFAEHALFAIWAHCVVFVIMMAIAAINLTGIGLPSRLMFPAYLAFFTVAAASFYEVKRWQAFLMGTGHLFLYALVIWFPVLLIFSLSFSGQRVDVWRYIMSYDTSVVGVERLVLPPPPPATVSQPAGKR